MLCYAARRYSSVGSCPVVEPTSAQLEMTLIKNSVLPDRSDNEELPASDASNTLINEDSAADDNAMGRHDRPSRGVTLLSCTIVVALAALVGWLAFSAYESHRVEQRHELFLQIARQGAINLTTIDHARADADVARILDSATGAFYDEFSQRSSSLVEVVRKVQSTSEGTVAEAAVESETTTTARVLVAVSVKTSTGAAPDQPARNWRMRIDVQHTDDGVKVAKVAFVA